ncbi:glycosyltransferase family 8 protein [Mixia osmundae IAM 14324]|uniref:Glycosyltransferase family 8 protein n=1 Tax=Mixia osmundae (strain CBS 9802 / IAM 14324 / JCM 22182 / KY 12970) TaxID=764103 RepID=G7DSR7_MIXOS|nr:glycosyltransferase family 8 protein [Mixia osmundae IAM 14324]KEI41807.1 glycosyltransferase family 8 protein [Mixia osmundae IAM 14324]GAA93625.1 hypothetical protein E5Q_00269 [Mixia osmundae IAM 14324]
MQRGSRQQRSSIDKRENILSAFALNLREGVSLTLSALALPLRSPPVHIGKMPYNSSANVSEPRKVFATLLTKRSYLAGLFVLLHSMHTVGTRYPLLVMITRDFEQDIEANAFLSWLAATYSASVLVRCVDRLDPPARLDGAAPSQFAAGARFDDTWTKLAAFRFTEYERVILLDIDMLLNRNIDDLMGMQLPADHIAATHACTCNPREISTYPEDWIPQNCAYMCTQAAQPPQILPDSPETHHLLNSGLVILQPSLSAYEDLLTALKTSQLVHSFRFPDQELLALVYRNRWQPLSYRYNALKTLRTCHEELWQDEEVCNIHYILDKPWTARPRPGDRDEYLNAIWWHHWDALVERHRSQLVPGWQVACASAAQATEAQDIKHQESTEAITAQ